MFLPTKLLVEAYRKSMMNDWHSVVTSTMPRRSISACQLVPALASVSRQVSKATMSKRRFIVTYRDRGE